MACAPCAAIGKSVASIKKPRKGGLRFGGAVAMTEMAKRARICTCKRPNVCQANKHKILPGEKHLVLFTPGRFGTERKVMCAQAGRYFLLSLMTECKRLHDDLSVIEGCDRRQPVESGIVTRDGLRFCGVGKT
jgi:hypothetical protein